MWCELFVLNGLDLYLQQSSQIKFFPLHWVCFKYCFQKHLHLTYFSSVKIERGVYKFHSLLQDSQFTFYSFN